VLDYLDSRLIMEMEKFVGQSICGLAGESERLRAERLRVDKGDHAVG
jgi:hypothetical protein